MTVDARARPSRRGPRRGSSPGPSSASRTSARRRAACRRRRRAAQRQREARQPASAAPPASRTRRRSIIARLLLGEQPLLHEIAHRAQPHLVGIAVDLARCLTRSLSPGHVANVDAHREQHVGRLAHRADEGELGAGLLGEIVLAAVALVDRRLLFDLRPRSAPDRRPRSGRSSFMSLVSSSVMSSRRRFSSGSMPLRHQPDLELLALIDEVEGEDDGLLAAQARPPGRARAPDAKATIRLAINAFPLERTRSLLDFLQRYCVMRLRVPNRVELQGACCRVVTPRRSQVRECKRQTLTSATPRYPFTAT